MKRSCAVQLLVASAALSCAASAWTTPPPPPQSPLPTKRGSPARRRSVLSAPTPPPPLPPHYATGAPEASSQLRPKSVPVRELSSQPDEPLRVASSLATGASEPRRAVERQVERLSVIPLHMAAPLQMRSVVAVRHPMTRRSRRSMSHLPHVNVTVRYPSSVATILIPLGHEMTTYSALMEAEMLYGFRHPTRDNTFSHRLEKLEEVPCWGVAAFGDVPGGSDESGRWHVRVTDQLQQSANRVLHSGICMPRGSALKMRTHYLVEFYLP